MNHKILAIKWRPKTFSEVIGQEHILKVLINSLAIKKIHQSYIFYGSHGIGKTTIARLFAKGLNCQKGITNEPCRLCSNCIEIENGNFIDLIEIDAASRTGIEDTKELIDNVCYLPIRGRFKIYLIDEVHMLSKHSFNALLKTLEEPPKYVKFLLATTDLKKVPVTILSRCLNLNLKILKDEQIICKLIDILNKEKINFDIASLKLIAKISSGSIRDALNIIDHINIMNFGEINIKSVKNILGTITIEETFIFINALFYLDSNKILDQIELCSQYEVNWDNVLLEILNLIYKIILNKVFFKKSSKDFKNILDIKIIELSKNFSLNDLYFYYFFLLKNRRNLHYAPDLRTGLEMILLYAMFLCSKYRKHNCNGKLGFIENIFDKYNENSFLLKDNNENNFKYLNEYDTINDDVNNR